MNTRLAQLYARAGDRHSSIDRRCARSASIPRLIGRGHRAALGQRRPLLIEHELATPGHRQRAPRMYVIGVARATSKKRFSVEVVRSLRQAWCSPSHPSPTRSLRSFRSLNAGGSMAGYPGATCPLTATRRGDIGA
jgi:hypothetical protein